MAERLPASTGRNMQGLASPDGDVHGSLMQAQLLEQSLLSLAGLPDTA
jgi:hypothetical protein